MFNISGGTIAGNIAGSGSSDTIDFNPGSGNIFTYGSNYGFSGIHQVNVTSGAVVLNGANTATSMTVSVAGALAGTGIITTALTIESGGGFAPGTPGTAGGTMTVNGSLALQSGAIYLVEVNPTTASSAVVSGTASLAGSVVDAVFASGSGYTTKKYDILQADSLAGTTFAGLTTNLPAGFAATLSYDPKDVYLNLTASLGNQGGLSPNQQGVATALNNYFNNGAALPPGFTNLFGMTGANLANNLSHLSGEPAADSEKGTFNLMTSFLELMLDPFVDGRFGAGGGATGFAPEQRRVSRPTSRSPIAPSSRKRRRRHRRSISAGARGDRRSAARAPSTAMPRSARIR